MNGILYILKAFYKTLPLEGCYKRKAFFAQSDLHFNALVLIMDICEGPLCAVFPTLIGQRNPLVAEHIARLCSVRQPQCLPEQPYQKL